MTSKEALQNIRDYHNEIVIDNYCTYTENIFEKELDIIEKDLEVLEIVKKHKLLNYVIKNEKCAKMYGLTQETINKIKEWLE